MCFPLQVSAGEMRISALERQLRESREAVETANGEMARQAAVIDAQERERDNLQVEQPKAEGEPLSLSGRRLLQFSPYEPPQSPDQGFRSSSLFCACHYPCVRFPRPCPSLRCPSPSALLRVVPSLLQEDLLPSPILRRRLLCAPISSPFWCLGTV